LGDDAEEPAKRESTADVGNPRRLITVLGWDFCLSDWTVDVATRTRFKALYTFWAFDIDGTVDMKRWEAMCSMTQRYSRVYRELGGLMGDLYSARPVFKHRTQAHGLPKRTKTAVLLWRAYLIRTELNLRAGIPTGRSIDSFRTRTPSVVIEFDGCPKGIGFRLFTTRGTREELVEEWGATAAYNLGNDPQYQNAMEVAAATCGLVMAVRRWGRDIAVHFRGDSETGLTWLANDMSSFHSHRARGAAMLLVTLRQEFGIMVDPHTSWIAGKSNIRADKLSRAEILDPIHNVPLTRATQGSLVMETLELCNPICHWQQESATSICQRWDHIREWCRRRVA
jgi:hypothetical protein